MHERCLPHKLAISHYVSSKFNGHVTPITGRLPGVNVLVSCRHELSASSPAPPIFRHITRVNHDWLLKPGVTRAGRGARGGRRTVTVTVTVTGPPQGPSRSRS